MNKIPKTTKNIKAILFDMVGVLIFKRPGYQAFTEAEINADKIEKLYNHIDDNKLLFDIDQTLHLDQKALEQAVCCIPAKYEKYSEIWNLLPKLKESYKLAVINNGNGLANQYWKERFDFSVFDIFVNSGVEKIRKPDPKIYLLTCERLDTRPEDCLFMDDSLENVEAAKNLGMATVWWNNEEGREKALEEFKTLIF